MDANRTFLNRIGKFRQKTRFFRSSAGDHLALQRQTQLLDNVYKELNLLSGGAQQNWTVECQMGAMSVNQITGVVNKYANVRISYTERANGPLEGVSANPRQWALMHKLTHHLLECGQVQYHRRHFSSPFSNSGGSSTSAKAEFFTQLQHMRRIPQRDPETGKTKECKYAAPGKLHDDGAKAWMYAMFGAKEQLPVM